MLNLYDEVIKDIRKDLEKADLLELPIKNTETWPDAGNSNMIFGSDMAYELGGSTKPLAALGCTVFTEDAALVDGNKSYLIGPDLCRIKEETPYARVTFLRVNGNLLGTGDRLYDNIRLIENTRYRINPEGFMMRVSSLQGREAVRVSKDAISRNISFAHIGKSFNDAFLKLPQIEAVNTYFITDDRFDFAEIEKKFRFSESITKTIDHVFANLSMDCNACNLKEICDEVEGLRELHFSRTSEEQ